MSPFQQPPNDADVKDELKRGFASLGIEFSIMDDFTCSSDKVKGGVDGTAVAQASALLHTIENSPFLSELSPEVIGGVAIRCYMHIQTGADASIAQEVVEDNQKRPLVIFSRTQSEVLQGSILVARSLDIIGKCLFRSFTQEESFSYSDLANGMYFGRTIDDDCATIFRALVSRNLQGLAMLDKDAEQSARRRLAFVRNAATRRISRRP